MRLQILIRIGRIVPWLMFWVGVELRSAPPANDSFDSRIPLSGRQLQLIGNIQEATVEAGEPALAAEGSGHTLWWSWTPTENGYLKLEDGLGILSVFEGDQLPSLLERRTARWEPPVFSPPPVFFPVDVTAGLLPVAAGVPYVFRVDSNQCTFEPPVVRPFPFPSSCRAMGTNLWFRIVSYAAARDAFSERQPTQWESGLFYSGSGHATTEPGEPENLHGLGRTVWWSWKVPETGRYVIEPRSGVVGVYRGDDLAQLERLMEVDTSDTNTIPIRVWDPSTWSPPPTWVGRKGETLAVRGDSLPGRTNDPITFQFRRLERPLNDDWANALTLTPFFGNAVTAQAEVSGATPETGEGPGVERSVWWRWTPASSGEWALIATGNPRVRVQTGLQRTELTTLAEIAPGMSAVRFRATNEKTYWISLDQPSASGSMTPGFMILPATAHDDSTGPLDVEPGPGAIRISLAGATLTSAESWASTNGFTRSVWMRWRAPANGVLALNKLTPARVALAVGPEANFSGGDTYWLPSFALPTTFEVSGQTTYLISVMSGSPAPHELEFTVDFTSRRLLRPVGNEVFSAGVQEITAELSPAADASETPLTGIGWQLFPWLDFSQALPDDAFPAGPQVTGNVAQWSRVPSGLWRVWVTLTNEYGRTITLAPPLVRLTPPGDSFSAALPITHFPWESPPFSVFGAGSEPDEPMEMGSGSTNGVWWIWTPATDGVVVVDRVSPPSAGLASIEVFQGAELASLQRVAGSEHQPLRLEVRAGTPLRFRTSAPRGYWANRPLQWRLMPQVVGDDFAVRRTLPAGGGEFELPSGPSTVEAGEAVLEDAPTPSLWWTWTAPADGTLILRGPTSPSSGSGILSRWRTFVGETVASLVPLPEVPLPFDPFLSPGAAFRVRREVPVQISGALWGGHEGTPYAARLEFVPDPVPGSLGEPVRMRLAGGDSLCFPATRIGMEGTTVEHSMDLRNWSPLSLTGDLDTLLWVGPLVVTEQPGFLRVVTGSGP